MGQSFWDIVRKNPFLRTWYESLTNRKGGPSATKLTAFFFSVVVFYPSYVALTIWSYRHDKWSEWVTVTDTMLWTILALLVGNIANKWVERKTENPVQQGPNNGQNPNPTEP